MDKSLAGLIGAVGALAAVAPAHAAENMGAALHEAMQVTSYADLLKPIPNAVALRDAFAESQAEAPSQPDVLQIQYYHHHHHHHHRYFRRRYYHHHHHHHGVRIGPVVIR